jgi:hypothetical protein
MPGWSVWHFSSMRRWTRRGPRLDLCQQPFLLLAFGNAGHDCKRKLRMLTRLTNNEARAASCSLPLAGPHGLRTPKEAFFYRKSQTFGLGQTNWADKFWVFWGLFFGRFISAHFGTVSPLSSFSITQPFYSYKKTKPLYPNPKYLIGIGIWIWAAKN